MNTNYNIKGVAVIGTRARGGIRAVIENHIQSGVYEGYQHYYIPSHDEVSVGKRLVLAVAALFTLLSLILRDKISICHFHGSMNASIYRKALYIFICRLFGIKTVFHLHGSEFAKTYEKAGHFYRHFVHYVLNRSESIFVLSSYWKSYIESISSNPNIWIVNNFPSPVFEKLYHHREFSHKGVIKLLFLGYIGQRKGIYDLVEAVELLKASNISGFKITVGGNGEIDTLRSLITDKGLDDYFNIVGWVSGEQKFNLLKESHLLLLPSHNEGLPIAILEALSAGVAVLSTRVGGIPDAIRDEDYGVLVEPGKPAALAKAIDRYLSTEDMIENVVHNGRALYENFYSAKINVKLIRQIFNGLIYA